MPAEVMIDAPAALARGFIARFEETAREAIAAQGRFACALPGGSAAHALFPALARAAVDWSRVEIFWGDERAVAPDDPEANYGLARRLWLDAVPIPPAQIHRMPADAPDLDGAATAYAAELTRTLAGRPLDLVLLGMGHDGHVCSLFPGQRALDESSRSVVAVLDSPKPPPRRLTLTLVPMTGASLVCTAAFGAEKAEAVREAIESPDSALPAARAARAGRRALYLLDPAAASRLSR